MTVSESPVKAQGLNEWHKRGKKSLFVIEWKRWNHQQFHQSAGCWNLAVSSCHLSEKINWGLLVYRCTSHIWLILFCLALCGKHVRVSNRGLPTAKSFAAKKKKVMHSYAATFCYLETLCGTSINQFLVSRLTAAANGLYYLAWHLSRHWSLPHLSEQGVRGNWGLSIYADISTLFRSVWVSVLVCVCVCMCMSAWLQCNCAVWLLCVYPTNATKSFTLTSAFANISWSRVSLP